MSVIPQLLFIKRFKTLFGVMYLYEYTTSKNADVAKYACSLKSCILSILCNQEKVMFWASTVCDMCIRL